MIARNAYDPAAVARATLRRARTTSLGTLDAGGGPFVTLASLATMGDGSPLLLLSDLALHTRNLARDPRASLLLIARGGEGGDPLAGARLTVSGLLQPTDDPAAPRRYAAAHGAEGPLRFADFHLYRMAVVGCHLVAGFGRIAAVPPADLLAGEPRCQALIDGEATLVARLNDELPAAIRRCALRLGAKRRDGWRIAACDPDGIDLAGPGERLRLDFPVRIASAAEAEAHLVRTADTAGE